MQDFLKPAVVLGLALLVVYWAWLYWFFSRLRPSLMKHVSRRLSVEVAESHDILDAGTYDIEDAKAPARKHAAVWGVDALVTIAGTVGAAAVLFVPAFMVAESGVLLPLEARLTGRGAAFEAIGEVGWSRGARASSASLTVSNRGAFALTACEVRTAYYDARNGYINGKSRMFDLSTGSTHRVELPLTAVQTPAKDLVVPLRLDCANERYAAADLRVVVR